MNRILIIDDSEERRRRIAEYVGSQLSENLEFETSDNVADAISKLKAKHFSVVFLDLVLPQKSDSSYKDPKGGLNILKRLNSGNLSVPTRIIGITAESDKNAQGFADEFESIGFKIFYASEYDFAWLESAMKQVMHAIRAESSSSSRVSEFAIFTIHGIHTFGVWQNRLEELLHDDEEIMHFESSHYKYPKYAPVKYLIPGVRKRTVRQVSEQFLNWVRENANKRLVCVAHSFGSYAIMNSILENLNEESLSKIDSIILSGSVLSQKFPIHKIISKHNISVYNECANQDIPLLFTNAFVLGTGMAGRRGFNGVTSQGKLYTRMYTGGHSVYFEQEGKIMRENWLPIIKGLDFEPLVGVYQEPSKMFQILESISVLLSWVKWVTYGLVFWMVFAWFF